MIHPDVNDAIAECERLHHFVTNLIEQGRNLPNARRVWPWFDEQGFEQSRRQYEQGTLMDFETFKNELLKASKRIGGREIACNH